MFCADQRLLADGRLLVVGGTIWRADPIDLREILGPDGPAEGTKELFGSNATRIFDPRTDSWRKGLEFMRHYRWYPTLITLADGRLFVASGVSRLVYNFRGTTVHQTEIYNPATEKWRNTGTSGETQLPLFARLHLLPDGTVFYSGVGQMFNPAGQGYDEALWNVQKIYDPKENAWSMSGIGEFGARSGAFSVMMPLKPPYDEARFLIGGGTLLTSPGAYIANNFSEMVTVKDGTSSSERTPDMVNPRWYSSGVLLPDGNVVALSGANRDEVLIPGSETPVTQAELFDGESWKPLESGARVRTYHNTAMLLPDGSILVGGHSPINTGYGGGGDNSAQPITGTNNLKDPSFEIFRPPYLFRGPRPRITRVDSGIAWKRDFKISSPDAGRVEKVVLMRLPTVTHITDADQRSIELDFRSTKPGSLSVEAPPSGNVAPPGYYYLFILTNAGEGLTPSNARIVRVGPRPDSRPALAPMGM
ncbi:MAG TPA: galactose oxidase early set domain-containing protein, partial [Actinomycetota bacterium]|nr:galactose oxidase early set domain-containing protein [Actinomycetota bacterium]